MSLPPDLVGSGNVCVPYSAIVHKALKCFDCLMLVPPCNVLPGDLEFHGIWACLSWSLCICYIEILLNWWCVRGPVSHNLTITANSFWFLTFANLIAKNETHCVMLVKLNINSYVYFSFVSCLCVLCLFFN